MSGVIPKRGALQPREGSPLYRRMGAGHPFAFSTG